MKYKELHDKYKTGEWTIRPYTMCFSREIPGSEIHKAPLGDFIRDYVEHLMSKERAILFSSQVELDNWRETEELMRVLLSVNVVFAGDGSAVVKWIGPLLPSLCEACNEETP